MNMQLTVHVANEFMSVLHKKGNWFVPWSKVFLQLWSAYLQRVIVTHEARL